MKTIRVYPDYTLMMQAAAEQFASLYEASVMAHGHFTVALSGGSTPKALYALLAEERFSRYIDWSNIYFFWGDERTVPPDDQESNYRMAKLALFDQVDVPAGNIFRMHGESDPAQAALDYEQRLIEFFKGRDDGRIVFDLVLLGMGDDGHTASLFQHTAALDEMEKQVVANFVPKLDTWRITLTTPAINAARHVMFLVTGAGKSAVLQEVLEGARQARELPSQLIDPVDGQLLWLLDEAAARLLAQTGS